MKAHPVRPFLGVLTGVIGLWALNASLPVAAQASVEACSEEITVSITILGVPTTTPPICFNRTERVTAGESENALASLDAPPVLGVSNLAYAASPESSSTWMVTAAGPVFRSEAGALEARLVNNGVTADALSAGLRCTPLSGSVTRCEVAMTAADLHVGGVDVPLPSEVPMNTQVPFMGTPIHVNPLGLNAVTVDVDGMATLNKVTKSNEGTANATIEHSGVSVEASGTGRLFGFGAFDVALKAADVERIRWPQAPGESFEARTIPWIDMENR